MIAEDIQGMDDEIEGLRDLARGLVAKQIKTKTGALAAELGLWLLLSRRAHRERWGDARRGLFEGLIRDALFRLARRPLRSSNWRPHVLVFTGDARHELELIRFGEWFSQGRGMVTVADLIVGDLLEEGCQDLVRKRE